MIPELGQFALALALGLALAQSILPLAGAARANATWMAVARPAAQGQLVFVAIAFGCLAWSFVNHDFSVLNVASNSNSQLPLAYRLAGHLGLARGIAALVGAHAASWTVAVHVFSRHLPEDVSALVIGVMVSSRGLSRVMLSHRIPSTG